VVVAAWSCYKLLSSWCVSVSNFLRFGYFGGGGGSCVAQTGSVEGLHLCMASHTWSATNEDKIGSSLHYFSRGSFLRGWLWRHRISTTFISLLQYFSPHMATCSFMDWILAIDAHILPDHVVQFTYSVRGLWARRSFLQLIWLACVLVCGTKETTVCSEMQLVLCIICWRKSRYYHLDDWRRRMLLLSQITIVGGRTHCFVWASTKFLYFYVVWPVLIPL
jgi:hypothetical protein